MINCKKRQGFKILKAVFPMILFVFLTACPQMVVRQIEESIPSDTLIYYKPIYLNTALPASNLIEENKNKNNISYDVVNNELNSLQLDMKEVDASYYPAEINLRVVVFDAKGHYISGLAPPEFVFTGDFKNYWFKLTDSCNGEKHKISSYNVTEIKENTSPPYAICFVLDHSPSMGDFRAKQLQEAVRYVLKAIKKGDYVSVVKFTSKMHVEIPLTKNRDEYINKLKVDGLKDNYGFGTAMYLSVLTGIRELKKADSSYKKIIILFTDGEDNQLIKPIDSVYRDAKSSGVRIYTIGYGPTREEPLKNLSDFSGGRFYRIFSSREFPFVISGILSESTT